MLIDYLMNFIVIFLILSGIFFFFTATVGLIRFPDFYCRLHATGKGDTLGAILVIFGIIIYILKEDFSPSTLLLCLKIGFVIFFILHANPTATHALTKAGLESQAKPLTKEELSK